MQIEEMLVVLNGQKHWRKDITGSNCLGEQVTAKTFGIVRGEGQISHLRVTTKQSKSSI